MSERGFKLMADGFTSLSRGVDGGRSPSSIGADQVTFAYNTTFRGEHPAQRPPFVYRATLPDFTGYFQGAESYLADNGRNHLLAMCGGRVFRVLPLQNWHTDEITISGDPNPSGLTYAWSVQAENYRIWQDGFSVPLIYDGSMLKRAATDQIKTGTVMAYSKGRIWYAAPDGLSFRATDLVKSASGTPHLQYRDSILFEKDNQYLNTVSGFAVPETSGGITAMVVPATLDVSMGQGPLQVFTPSTVFSVDAPVDKATWQNLEYPIQTTSQINYGAIGPRSAVSVNGDIFYRAPDGIRSFIIARRDYGTWGNLPVSREIRNRLAFDQANLLPFGSAVLFDNRLLMTCWPFHTRYGIYHNALAVLNFDEVGTMLDKGPPAWEDVWTGLKFLQLVKGTFRGVERCFAFCLNTANKVEIWEIMKGGYFDDYGGHKSRIIWSFGTPAYSWKNRFSQKKLISAQIFVDSIRERVNFDVKWKPDQYPCWIDWHQWSECAKIEQCYLSGPCPELKNLKPQYRAKIKLPQPPDTCDEINGTYRNFFEAQFMFTITGPARILQTRFITQDLDEVMSVECPTDSPCKELNVCCSPFDYHSDGSAYPTPYPDSETEASTPVTPTTGTDTNDDGTPDVDLPPGGNSGTLSPPDEPVPEVPDEPELPDQSPVLWPSGITLPPTYPDNGKGTSSIQLSYGWFPFTEADFATSMDADRITFAKTKLAAVITDFVANYMTIGYQLKAIGDPYMWFEDWGTVGYHYNAEADYEGTAGAEFYGSFGWGAYVYLELQEI